MKKIVFTLSFVCIFLNSIAFVEAHPGRTAADGCHYCRTNCDKWGVAWNQRHCHNSPAVLTPKTKTITPKPTKAVVTPKVTKLKTITKSVVKPTPTPVLKKVNKILFSN